MKSLIVAFFLALPLILFAQSFETLIDRADSLYEAKSYSASGAVYDQAFADSEGSAGQYYNAACTWALAGDTEKALRYLNLAAEKGWTNRSWLELDKDLNSLHEEAGWAEIVEKVQANLDEVEKGYDKSLQARLEKVFVKDQTLRQLAGVAEEKFGRESQEMQYFWGLVATQDSLNEQEIVTILEERGWPGRSLVGGKANMAVWLVIQHTPLEVQEKYLPMMQASVRKGESQGSHLAMLEDRILMRNGKKQKYGSQITVDAETGRQVFYPIEDPDNVNKRRAEVGLPPLEDYAKRMGVEFDPSDHE